MSGVSDNNNPRSIALIANTDFNLARFRGRLIQTLVRDGWSVFAVAPKGDYKEEIEKLGASFVEWSVSRRASNPMGEMLQLFSLIRLLRRIKPLVTHTFTLKPNIYGSIASRIARIPIVLNSFTGLGFVFTETSYRSKAMGIAISPLLKISSRLADVVSFQNQQDLNLMVARNLVPAKRATYLPGGSGVDIDYFSGASRDNESNSRLRKELEIPRNVPVVLLASRMLWHKGIGEYVASARMVKSRLAARFLLVGPLDPGNLAGIPLNQIEEWNKSGCVQYLGERTDIPDLLRVSDIVVLPSYREGVPRILIEAAAMGRPIITTDAPGCRDVVEDGVNGYLVRIGEDKELSGRIEELILDQQKRIQFGLASRVKAESEFDERRIASNVVSLYNELIEQKHLD